METTATARTATTADAAPAGSRSALRTGAAVHSLVAWATSMLCGSCEWSATATRSAGVGAACAGVIATELGNAHSVIGLITCIDMMPMISTTTTPTVRSDTVRRSELTVTATFIPPQYCPDMSLWITKLRQYVVLWSSSVSGLPTLLHSLTRFVE